MADNYSTVARKQVFICVTVTSEPTSVIWDVNVYASQGI